MPNTTPPGSGSKPNRLFAWFLVATAGGAIACGGATLVWLGVASDDTAQWAIGAIITVAGLALAIPTWLYVRKEIDKLSNNDRKPGK